MRDRTRPAHYLQRFVVTMIRSYAVCSSFRRNRADSRARVVTGELQHRVLSESPRPLAYELHRRIADEALGLGDRLLGATESSGWRYRRSSVLGNRRGAMPLTGGRAETAARPPPGRAPCARRGRRRSWRNGRRTPPAARAYGRHAGAQRLNPRANMPRDWVTGTTASSVAVDTTASAARGHAPRLGQRHHRVLRAVDQQHRRHAPCTWWSGDAAR